MYYVETGFCKDWSVNLERWNEHISNEVSCEFVSLDKALECLDEVKNHIDGEYGLYVSLSKDEDIIDTYYTDPNGVMYSEESGICINLDEAVSRADDYGLDVHDRESMIDFAKYCIDEDRIFQAIYVLKAIDEDVADYYSYNYSMGTLESIEPIKTVQDIIDIYGKDFLGN